MVVVDGTVRVPVAAATASSCPPVPVAEERDLVDSVVSAPVPVAAS